jgi:MFS family permease
MARKWWTLGAVCVATFMLLLDITVVNTALPAIREDLGGSFTDLQWVVDAYALSLAALVLTAGSLADRLGRRRVFAIGLGIFSLASLLCAIAPDPTFLNVSRGLQGVGGAIMFAVSLALVAQEFPSGPERGMAMGIYGATIGIAVAIGPLVGGLLTDGLGWEWVFLLNVPIGLAAIAVTYWKLAESRGGIGLLNPVIADVALSVVPKERSGMAAGINDTFRQVGIAVGIAAWGAIFLGVGAAKTQDVAAGAVSGDQARQLVEATSAGALPQALASAPQQAQPALRNAAEQGFLHGLNEILVLGALLSFAGAVAALWLVREREIERETAAEAPPEPEPAPEAARA